MKCQTVEGFIKAQTEEDLWKIIEDYETYYDIEDGEFLRQKAREYCDKYYYMDYMKDIVLYAYRYFAMKYKEIGNEEIKILDVDEKGSRIKVIRNQN